MADKNTKEIEELYARLGDLQERAARGDVGISAFLSPRECHLASMFLGKHGTAFDAFGGYADAERKRIYIFPDFLEGVSVPNGLRDYGYDDGIALLRADGSGFERLCHRDFLGSILALGIERRVIGDIILDGEGRAYVFCERSIVDFLLSEWKSVGRDKIRLTVEQDASVVRIERRFAPVSDTVASPRFDCVVGALCSLSRDRAKSCIESGLAELDYECEERIDREVKTPCLISVRGYGKFRVISLSDKTKKGRFRLVAEKFI